MVNINKLIVLLFLFISELFAQQSLTLKQVVLERETVSPKKLSQIYWIPKNDKFSYVKDNILYYESVDGNDKGEMLNLNKLNENLKSNNLNNFGTFPSFSWYSQNEIWFWDGNKLIIYNFQKSELKIRNEIREGGENTDFVDADKIAYTIDNNLFIAQNGKQIAVTNDSDTRIVNGQIVSRVEFGISKGTFWSPNAKYLAFYRKDETKVTNYPILNIDDHPTTVKWIKYPMAGMHSEYLSIGVYNVNTGKTIFLKTEKKSDQYLPGVTWSPDEKYIYVNKLNRDQNHLELTKYSAITGEKVSILFEENNDKYVEPMQGPIFFKNEPDIFLWLSRNEGWNHLSLYDASGTRIHKINKDEWEITSFNGFDDTGVYAFFTAAAESPLDRNFYKLNLNNYEYTPLTTGPGIHTVTKNNKCNYFLDEYTSYDTPYKLSLLDSDGNVIRTVYEAPNPLAGYSIGKTEIVKLKSEDGFDLYGRIIYPPDFDSTKAYPVLVYVYGGPHEQLIENSWLYEAGLWLNFMAEQGFIVFTLDNRGSNNRGLKFEQVIFRNLGTEEIKDQMIGVDYLKSLPFVDSQNMGVFGWSYGGFMATSLMTRTPDVFKAGVAGGAVIDWSYYEVMYTERYMDTPQTNPDGYKNSSLLNYVQNLNGKLLLVHGTSDPTVVWQNTLLFAQQAAHLGIDLDYYPYIGQQHGVRGVDRFQLYLKITNYFKQYLMN